MHDIADIRVEENGSEESVASLEDEDGALSDESSSASKDSSSEEDSEDDGQGQDVSSKTVDQPERADYKDGLRAKAELLAAKFRLKHPFLECTSDEREDTNYEWPRWMDCHKKLEIAKPSSALMEMVRKMDIIFLQQHGVEIDRLPGVMKR